MHIPIWGTVPKMGYASHHYLFQLKDHNVFDGMSEGGCGVGDPPGGVRGPQGGGCRRRRLTLAPRPRDRTKAEVSGLVFAGSEDDEGRPATTDGASLAETQASFVCSSVGSSSELVADFVNATHGSRFWALGGDDELDDGAPTPRSERMLAAAVPALRPEPAPDGAMRRDGGRLLRPIRCPKPARRPSSRCKPWRGPIPPSGYARAWTFGDLQAVDRRTGWRNCLVKVADLAAEKEELAGSRRGKGEGEGSPVLLPVEGGRRWIQNSNRCSVSLRWTGLCSEKLMGQGEAQNVFHFAKGLGHLFLAQGRRTVRGSHRFAP
jgi:hypothetical protein